MDPPKSIAGAPHFFGAFRRRDNDVSPDLRRTPYVAEKKEWEEGSEKNEEEDAEDFLGATPPYMKREDPF